MVGSNVLDEQLKACSQLVGKGSVNAVTGLGQMLGRDLKVSSFDARRVQVSSAPDLVGGWETVTLGVYLAVTGCANGHMFMVYQPETAMALADFLLGNPPGTTKNLAEMEESALGEMGNIMGSFVPLPSDHTLKSFSELTELYAVTFMLYAPLVKLALARCSVIFTVTPSVHAEPFSMV